MEIDSDDLGGYLGSAAFVPSDLAAVHSVTEPKFISNNMHVDDGGGGGGGPAGGSHGVGSSVFSQSHDNINDQDMAAMVAERRRSLANDGFGLDYLSMGEDGGFSSMVPPPYLTPRIQGSLGVSTTMGEVMAMDASVPPGMNMLDYGTGMSALEMQSSMPMFSNRPIDSIQHGGGSGNGGEGESQSSPPEGILMNSVETSPTVTQMPQQSIAATPISSDLSMNQRSNQTSIEQSMMDRTMPGMSCYRWPPYDNNTYGDSDMTPSNDHLTSKQNEPRQTQYLNRYSTSGFDMMDILRRVANRPNPRINIGAVDMSCSFVLTDIRKFDNPIVYCSATFERLTGYTKHEILGRNCRFLQSPDGNIRGGEKRKYVDGRTVSRLKESIDDRSEVQETLINYRKGGQSFTNLLTMIPITMEDGNDVVYFVGFQIDLLDQPSAVQSRNTDGSFDVNYQYSHLTAYVPVATMEQRPKLTVGRDDVSQVLASFGTGILEVHSKRILDKVLLENTDDVVHVLSLKGLFLYCSISTRKVLEYEPHELVGSSLSGVCHPSDIVPVTRDLKDTSGGSSINVVFRIRRKYSGYTWFESHGCLHTEQGKGRKYIILVGRERPVYVLGSTDVNNTGGIGENELWTKLSTSGMFLHVSSNSKVLLDREADDLTGTSFQALMRTESKNELGKALEMARMGNKQTVRHEVQHKRAQFIQALTTLFPGDGNGFGRPTFLIAQTRLFKLSRTTAPVCNSQQKSKRPAEDPVNPIGSHENNDDPQDFDDNMFEELKTTRSTSWQYELRQMQKTNKKLAEELESLMTAKKEEETKEGCRPTRKGLCKLPHP